jgi:hypothetical protein
MTPRLRRCPSALALVIPLAWACAPPEASKAAPGGGDGGDETGGQETGAPTGPALQVERRSTAACADPGARATSPLRPWPTLTLLEDGVDDAATNYASAGITAVDLNGDDWTDLYLGSSQVHRLLLSRGPGVWVEQNSGLPPVAGRLVVGAIPADYDADGDQDLYLLVLHGPNALWQNDGAGRFTDVTAAAGLGLEAEDTVHATWADLDGDLDLDLVVSNHWEGPHLAEFIETGVWLPAHPNRVYLSDGDGTFTEVTDQLPAPARDGYSFVEVAVDLDEDGLPELYSVNDFGRFATPNVLARRAATGWELASTPTGLDLALFGMSASVGDLNGDGRWDLAMSSWGELAVVETDTNGDFYRSDRSRGLTLSIEQETAWGSALQDLDNDGDLDLAVTMGPIVGDPETEEEAAAAYGVRHVEDQPDGLWIQGEDGWFTDEAPAWGFDRRGIGRGLLAVDLDLDGTLDLIRREVDGPTRVEQGVCGENNGLVLSLRQSGPNPDAIGAVIEVEVGGRVHRRRVHAGGEGMATGGPPEVHVGLGDATAADAVRVRWPDGERSTLADPAALGAGALRLVRGG